MYSALNDNEIVKKTCFSKHYYHATSMWILNKISFKCHVFTRSPILFNTCGTFFSCGIKKVIIKMLFFI